ncbi:MAG: sodium:proton antiporter [Bacteroidales bacterium]|nr:sodium:proton antiporter [Bacteroidales bacterium]HPD94901.1 hypothetical protein [Tenuifilaceae bacterium]HRX30684.1 hypothetical protein [Tenuifilaceae bacterium]
MTLPIIITISALLLFAYLFDLSASKTRIPSVILLLALGWLVKQITSFLGYSFPAFANVLPLLGTIGLVLIILEGALELEISRSKLKLILKSFLGALSSILVLSVSMALTLFYIGDFPFIDSLINVIPLCIISSAIAISSVRDSSPFNREFVTYESSFSDIIGVLLFNFLVTNDSITIGSFGNFSLQLVLMGIISFIATIGLSFLLSRIEHHIKFIPIILLVILIYAIAELWHLPALIFIMLLGLFLGNLKMIKKIHRIRQIENLRINELCNEVKRFKELIGEATFLVRSLFFLLFGYLIETSEITNIETLGISIAIVIFIYIVRYVQLKLSKLPIMPLLFIAPRGLITLLLFISITTNRISFINRSLITQVVIISVLSMMFGFIFSKGKTTGDLDTQEKLEAQQ